MLRRRKGGEVEQAGLADKESSTGATSDAVRVPVFGARSRAPEMAAEIARLRVEQERLGILSVTELERRREALEVEIAEQAARLDRERKEAVAQAERETSAARDKARKELTKLQHEQAGIRAELETLRAAVVVTEETALLQEAGVYEYGHPLSDAVAYQAELRRLRDQIKTMTRKDGRAIHATTNWTVNGSASKGRVMVRDFSKLMLRAYNAEADNLVRGLKPYKLSSAVDRLTKVTTTIAKLGKTMDIRTSDPYHRLRIRELEFTADYLEKLAEEKNAKAKSANASRKNAAPNRRCSGSVTASRRNAGITRTPSKPSWPRGTRKAPHDCASSWPTLTAPLKTSTTAEPTSGRATST